MKRVFALTLCAVLLAGCGAYRITFKDSPRRPVPGEPIMKRHSHGVGPLFIGGGVGFFWLFNPMSPPLIDYTGPQNVADTCPQGIAELTHYQPFGLNAQAALISWIGIVNWYQRTSVFYTCAEPLQSSLP